MIVVSNTSPLTNLAAIGQLDLVRQLYAHLYIPLAVWEELRAPGVNWPGQDQVTTASWIERRLVGDRAVVTALRRDLDGGEAEAIALALELNADLILLDEKEGRHAARRLGLRVTGVGGVLLEAKAAGAISAVRPSLDALRWTAGFYLNETVYQYLLLLAGELESS